MERKPPFLHCAVKLNVNGAFTWNAALKYGPTTFKVVASVSRPEETLGRQHEAGKGATFAAVATDN